MGTADLHIHSTYSDDGTVTIEGILSRAASIGLDVIAIADHDEIRGSREARDLAPAFGIEAIPGMEIGTSEGHLLALFIEKIIPSGLPLIETLIRIGDLGGIAIAPHPINPLPGSLPMDSILRAHAHPQATKVLTGIEVYNMGYEIFTRRVKKLTARLPLAKTAGSDSHVYWTIGVGRTGFEGHTAEHLRLALENNETEAIPAPSTFSMRPIIGWMGLTVRRWLGFVSDSMGPNQPIRTRSTWLNRIYRG